MRSLWIVVPLVACSKPAADYVDVWTSRPVEQASSTLVADGAKVPFTIQLPQGMFHDPSTKSDSKHYGVWTADGLQDADTPGAIVRLRPNGPLTLDALVTDEADGDEVVAKNTLADGTLTITTRRGTHAWRVKQIHFDREGRAVYCAAWRHDDKHDLGEPTRRMLEKLCGSLSIGSLGAPSP